jgi:hypothetical protein
LDVDLAGVTLVNLCRPAGLLIVSLEPLEFLDERPPATALLVCTEDLRFDFDGSVDLGTLCDRFDEVLLEPFEERDSVETVFDRPRFDGGFIMLSFDNFKMDF